MAPLFNIQIPQQPGGTYSYSQFSRFQQDSLYLILEDDEGKTVSKLPLVAYSGNFSLNEIPQATCTVGVGRDTSSDGGTTLAPIHNAIDWRKLQPAKVYFNPSGNSSKDTAWPENPFVIFDGYVTSVRRVKSFGKYQIEISLTHWLFDLACSSAISGNSHVANPGDLTEAAVFDVGVKGSGNTSNILGGSLAAAVSGALQTDLWGSLKTVFAAYADNVPMGRFSGCLDAVFVRHNIRAIKALSRIEGPDLSENGTTFKNYEFGQPLVFDFADLSASVLDGIETAINTELIHTYAEASLWTKLISQFCPIFGLSVVPMIDSALVIADTPIYTSPEKLPYKTITPEDYDNETTAGTMDRPLAGVVVISSPTSPTNAAKADGVSNIVGCYVANEENPDGVVLSVGTPPWLNYIPTSERTDSTQGNTGSANTIREIFNRWAKDVYVRNALRGRTQTVNGRLRFDIAPGSIVRISSSRESTPLDLFNLFQSITDKLVFDTFGQVARVSVYINTEAPAAGTSFLLTNVRTAEEYSGENPKIAYSVSSPAIFSQDSIHGGGLHGAPLSTVFK